MAKVLIVEDSGYMRNIVRHALTDAGHEVIGEAEDGHTALSLITKNQPDVVFLDIILPGMIGLDMIKIIKKSHPEIKIIIVSVLEDQSIQQEAYQSGASAYICKPFSEENIKKTMNGLYH
jgi:two-component system chemotaxis response regulator CheY